MLRTASERVIPDFSLSPRIDQVGIEERASRFTKRSIKKDAKMNGLKLVLNMIDLTTLEGKDTEGKVKQLCYKAMHPHDAFPDLPTVAAICVYPSMVKVAKKAFDIKGETAIVFDDIISTGSTMVSAAKILKELGARKVFAACAHPLLIGDAEKRILNAGVEEIVGTDSVFSSVSKVSLAPLISKELKALKSG